MVGDWLDRVRVFGCGLKVGERGCKWAEVGLNWVGVG